MAVMKHGQVDYVSFESFFVASTIVHGTEELVVFMI